MPDEWRLWLERLRLISPGNVGELGTVEAYQGRYLGYGRVVGRPASRGEAGRTYCLFKRSLRRRHYCAAIASTRLSHDNHDA